MRISTPLTDESKARIRPATPVEAPDISGVTIVPVAINIKFARSGAGALVAAPDG